MKQEIDALKADIGRGDRPAALARLEAHPAIARDWRPILEASLFGEIQVLRRLLELGADPDAVSESESRYRPLHRAIEPKASIPRTPGHRACIEALLDAGADVDGAGCWYDGRPLETAAREAMRAEAELLLGAGAKRDVCAAVLTGDAGLLAARIAEDANAATLPSPNGAAAMHLLCASRITERRGVALADQLEGAGASATEPARMRHGTFPPIHFATYRANPDLALIGWLIDHGAVAQDGLYETMWCGDFAAADLLVGRGADANGVWAHSTRPLVLEMIQWGHNDAAFWLLDHGADPNRRDDKGWSALHYAAHRGASPALVQRLLAAGADPALRGADGQTAAAVARARGKTAVAAIL